MSNIETGGPAFPVFPETGVGHESAFRGMTLRDYFAAKAMQGFIGEETERGMSYDQVAEVAYNYADAMLKARGA